MDKKGEEGDEEVPLRVQDSPGGRFFGQVGEQVCLHRISRYWISRLQGLYSRDGHLGVTLIKFASDHQTFQPLRESSVTSVALRNGWPCMSFFSCISGTRLAVLKSNGLGDCSCPCRFEAGIIWVFKKIVSRLILGWFICRY